MKNILVVLGGGRPNGNTKKLVDAFIKGAKEVGHKVEFQQVTIIRQSLG